MNNLQLTQFDAALLGYNNRFEGSILNTDSNYELQDLRIFVLNEFDERVPEVEQEIIDFLNNE
jgi:hypothetical protein